MQRGRFRPRGAINTRRGNEPATSRWELGRRARAAHCIRHYQQTPSRPVDVKNHLRDAH